MSNYTINIDFDVDAENIHEARDFADFIQTLVAAQVENKKLFNALTSIECCEVYDWSGDDE